ncbi:hypothetical protein ACFV7R_15345 [Streptomyces sp. NPDC059866]|uniref:hypothetical protein n=1 Tax=Streptomyces sp. NPDC059866 TaxID=3346978 RepID=UPI003658B4E9
MGTGTGPLYWNEETQRWEEAGGGAAHTDGGVGAAVAGPAGPDAGAGAGGAAADVPPPAGGAAPGGGVAPAAPPPPPPHVSPSVPTLTGIQRPGSGPEPAPWPPYGTAYPPGVPEPVPAGPRRGGRGKVWAVLGGAAAVGVVVGLVVTLVVRDEEASDGRAGDGRAAASASASQSPGASGSGLPSDPGPQETATGSPSALNSDLPAGFEAYDDPQGFTIARPTGWTRTTVSSQYGIDVVHYRSPDGGRRLQVFEVSEASPEESHELFLSDAVPKGPGFTELSLENLDDGDFTGSRLEYLVDSIKGEPDIGTWYVVDERFMAADGKLYAIAAYGADADGRDDERELLRTALGAFCPPYTTCGTDAG